MNRIDRLQAILIHLQSKKVVTANELAERFGLSIRTVYRDIRALEEAGVPIGAEAGIGYFLDDSYHLPPVMFTSDEACALLIGSKFVEEMSDEQTKQCFQSALFKIRSVLSGKQKESIDILQNNIHVVGSQKHNDNREKAILAIVQKSLVEKKCLCVHYHASYNNGKSERKVEPIGLVFYGNNWHLIAYCLLRNDYRDLRVDRVLSVEMLDEPFTQKNHITLDDYFSRSMGTDELHKIELLVRRSCLHHIKESKYWYGFTYEEVYSDEWCKLSFRNADLMGFSRWVIMGGGDIRVLSPVELKNQVNAIIDELMVVRNSSNE